MKRGKYKRKELGPERGKDRDGEELTLSVVRDDSFKKRPKKKRRTGPKYSYRKNVIFSLFRHQCPGLWWGSHILPGQEKKRGKGKKSGGRKKGWGSSQTGGHSWVSMAADQGVGGGGKRVEEGETCWGGKGDRGGKESQKIII